MCVCPLTSTLHTCMEAAKSQAQAGALGLVLHSSHLTQIHLTSVHADLAGPKYHLVEILNRQYGPILVFITIHLIASQCTLIIAMLFPETTTTKAQLCLH